jgi:hypothetical protein
LNFSKSSFHYIVKARKGIETSGASNISTANTAALGLVSCHSDPLNGVKGKNPEMFSLDVSLRSTLQ